MSYNEIPHASHGCRDNSALLLLERKKQMLRTEDSDRLCLEGGGMLLRVSAINLRIHPEVAFYA